MPCLPRDSDCPRRPRSRRRRCPGCGGWRPIHEHDLEAVAAICGVPVDAARALVEQGKIVAEIVVCARRRDLLVAPDVWAELCELEPWGKPRRGQG